MNKVLNTVLSLVALLALGAVTVGITQLAAVGSEPVAQATATPAPTAASTTEPAATPVPIPPRVAPSPLVIRGEKAWRELVNYAPAYLTVWSVDPVTKTPNAGDNFILSWTRATGPKGSTNLEFSPITTIYTYTNPTSGITRNGYWCDQTYPITMSGTRGNCYQARASTLDLDVGEYQGTLYVSDAAGAETQVPIIVYVGRSLWDLVLTVLVGILATEFWVWWSKNGRFKLGWSQHRKIWMGWLSKDQTWTQYQGTDDPQGLTKRDVLRAVQNDLRTKLKSISDWLEQSQSGKLSVADLPSTPESIRQFTDPLLDVGRRYLESTDKTLAWRNEVVKAFLTFSNEAKQSYEDLERTYAGLTGPVLENACALAKNIWKNLTTDWQGMGNVSILRPPRKSAEVLSSIRPLLSYYYVKLDRNSIASAKVQATKIRNIPDTVEGKKELLEFLDDKIAIFDRGLELLDGYVKHLNDWLEQNPGGVISRDDWELGTGEVHERLSNLIQVVVSLNDKTWDDLLEAFREFYDQNCNPGKDPRDAYDILAGCWAGGKSPDDKTMRETWRLAQKIWKNLLELREQVAKLPKPQASTVTAVAQCVAALTAHVKKLKQDVMTSAEAQIETVEELDDKVYGKAESLKFLRSIVNIDTEHIEDRIKTVQYPLQSTAFTQQIKGLQDKLDYLSKLIEQLTYASLRVDVVHAVMLASVQKSLSDVDAKVANSPTSLSAVWNEVDMTHHEKERVIQLGLQIETLLKSYSRNEPVPEQQTKHSRSIMDVVGRLLGHPRDSARRFFQRIRRWWRAPSVNDPALELRLRQGYQYLLRGDILAAEIEVEKARADIARKRVPYRRAIPYNLGIVGLLIVVLLVSALLGLLIWSVFSGGPALSHSLLQLIIFILIVIGIGIAGVVGWRVYGEVFHALADGALLARLKRTVRYGSFTTTLVLMLLTLFWAAISLTIAVTTIIAAREVILKNSLSSWGTTLDIIVAFTWGAVANRLLQNLKSNWEGVQSYVEGSETSKSETGKEGVKS